MWHCFAQPITLKCTTVCLLSSSLLYSSAGGQCGFFPSHFQMHKTNLVLESVDAAFPGLQSELVWQEHQQERINIERQHMITVTCKAHFVVLLSGILTKASKQGVLPQSGPINPSLLFPCPLPKIHRKAVKPDRQRNQRPVLLPGYPQLNLWGTWGHCVWLNKWLFCPGGINLMWACQRKPYIFMGSFQRSCMGSEFLFSSETELLPAWLWGERHVPELSPEEQQCICTDLSLLQLA